MNLAAALPAEARSARRSLSHAVAMAAAVQPSARQDDK
tara:strand:+ start:279 stop:392 length:114 start_codon:yes stop_codon:yes gene_type:complete